MNKIYLISILFFLVSCKEDKDNSNPSPINESDQYSICNSILTSCLASSGDYCLFGYKWGDDTNFDEVGVNAVGPQTTGGIISYSFQEENGLVNTHRQINLPSQSFDELIDCAQTEIRNAFDAWAEVADIEFEEMVDNSDADIKIFVADIIQSGIGYPNFLESECNLLKGTLIIKTQISIENCDDFFAFSMHEIGHVLGLGHVTTANVMSKDFFGYHFEGLQEGDKKGIIEIYGED